MKSTQQIYQDYHNVLDEIGLTSKAGKSFQNILKELEKQEWKDCKKEQPEDKVKVIIWYLRADFDNEGNHIPGVCFGRFYKTLGQWRPEGGNGDFTDLIIYWKPAPKGPV
jgi:hypothetical protein